MIWIGLIVLGVVMVGWGVYRIRTRPLRYAAHPFDWWEHPPRHEPNRYRRTR